MGAFLQQFRLGTFGDFLANGADEGLGFSAFDQGPLFVLVAALGATTVGATVGTTVGTTVL